MVALSHAGRKGVLRCAIIGGWLAISPVPSAYQPLRGVQKAQTDERLARPVCLLENPDTVTKAGADTPGTRKIPASSESRTAQSTGSSTPRQESADLSEDARRNLFLEIARVRIQAKTEAEKTYPTGSSGFLAPSSGKSTRLDMKRNAMTVSLEAQYLEPVIDTHRVSCDQIRQIFQEGQSKKWPSR
jgi:hypothetical protein